MITAGVNAGALQTYMGHSSITVTLDRSRITMRSTRSSETRRGSSEKPSAGGWRSGPRRSYWNAALCRQRNGSRPRRGAGQLGARRVRRRPPCNCFSGPIRPSSVYGGRGLTSVVVRKGRFHKFFPPKGLFARSRQIIADDAPQRGSGDLSRGPPAGHARPRGPWPAPRCPSSSSPTSRLYADEVERRASNDRSCVTP